MITTAAAILGSAVLGAGASMLASHNAASAAEKQGQLTADATAQARAENAREFDTIQANNAPARQIGNSAMSAIGGAFGLEGYGPSMTGRVASTPVPGAGGISMTQGQYRDRGTGMGTQAVYPDKTGMVRDPASVGPGGGISYANTDYGPPSMTGGPGMGHNGGPTFDAYNTANPDISAEWSRIQAAGGDPRFATEGDYLAWHDANYPQENRPSYADPNAPQGQPTMTGGPGSTSGTPAGYNDPTAPNGYTVGPRPMTAPTPSGYTPGSLDVSLGSYQQSPDFNFRLAEGNKALDHVSSSMGGLMSGARLKAAARYNQDFATTDYNNWRDFTANRFDTANNLGNTLAQERIAQSNADRARSDGLYQDDRSYDAGRYDTRNSQLLTLAGFGQNATNSTNAAGQSFAANQGNLLMTGAAAQGNAAVNGANAFTSGVNNLLTTGAYLGGRYMTGGFSSPTPGAGYDELAGLY
jgi:hypothetical protein